MAATPCIPATPFARCFTSSCAHHQKGPGPTACHAAACLLQVCVVVGDACPSLTNKWGQRERDYPILTCQGA